MAHFRYDQNLPSKQNAKASFGTIIHACIEQFDLTGDVDLVVENFRDLWKNPDKLNVTPDVWPKFTTWGSLNERGVGILREYAEKQKWDKGELVAQEHGFLIPFGEHELTGYVDKIELRKNNRGKWILRLIDFKTNAKNPSFAELALNIQFTVYIYASLQPAFWLGSGPDFPGLPNGEWFQQLHQDTPRRGIWYSLWNGKEADVGTRDQSDFDRMYRACCEIERAYEHKVFVPDISGSSCGICDYTEPCGVRIPTKDELQEDENAWV